MPGTLPVLNEKAIEKAIKFGVAINAEIAEKARLLFDLRPYAIEQRLKLRNPIYLETASYGHMGRKPHTVTKTFESPYNGKVSKEVELFTWEQLDYILKIKNIRKFFILC